MSLITRNNWIIYNTNDIGPVMYVDRYNGGAISFYYNKKTHELCVRNRGVNTPYAYILHDGGRKSKRFGLFYKFYCNNTEYFCEVADANRYLPDALPEDCVSHCVSTSKNKLDILELQKYLETTIQLSKDISGCMKVHYDDELDNFSDINKIDIIYSNLNMTILSLTKQINDNGEYKYKFNVNINMPGTEIIIRTTIATVDDFKRELDYLMIELSRFKIFSELINDLMTCFPD